MTLITFFIILSILVLVHEFGHYITAKKSGIKVEEFGLGIPPRVFGKKIGETLYSLNLLPLGGFVKLYGEDSFDTETSNHPKSYASKPWYKRMLVIVAGVIMNLILAVSLYYVFFYFNNNQSFTLPVIYDHNFAFGNKVQSDNIIMGISTESNAYDIGINPGDSIISINGQEVKNINDIKNILASLQVSNQTTNSSTNQNTESITEQVIDSTSNTNFDQGINSNSNQNIEENSNNATTNEDIINSQTDDLNSVNINQSAPQPNLTDTESNKNIPELNLTVQVKKFSSDQTQEYIFSPIQNQNNEPILGVYLGSALTLTYDTAVQKALSGFMHTYNMFSYSVGSLLNLVKTSFVNNDISAVSQSVSGPVGIYNVVGSIIDHSEQNLILSLLDFTALLSISLAFINMLPIPALDGGRFLFIIIEVLRGGKKISRELEARIHGYGMFLLLGLFVLITIKDIMQ